MNVMGVDPPACCKAFREPVGPDVLEDGIGFVKILQEILDSNDSGTESLTKMGETKLSCVCCEDTEGSQDPDLLEEGLSPELFAALVLSLIAEGMENNAVSCKFSNEHLSVNEDILFPIADCKDGNPVLEIGDIEQKLRDKIGALLEAVSALLLRNNGHDEFIQSSGISDKETVNAILFEIYGAVDEVLAEFGKAVNVSVENLKEELGNIFESVTEIFLGEVSQKPLSFGDEGLSEGKPCNSAAGTNAAVLWKSEALNNKELVREIAAKITTKLTTQNLARTGAAVSEELLSEESKALVDERAIKELVAEVATKVSERLTKLVDSFNLDLSARKMGTNADLNSTNQKNSPEKISFHGDFNGKTSPLSKGAFHEGDFTSSFSAANDFSKKNDGANVAVKVKGGAEEEVGFQGGFEKAPVFKSVDNQVFVPKTAGEYGIMGKDEKGFLGQVIRKFEVLLLGGRKEAYLRLEPKELGTLRIKIVMEDGMISARLEANNHMVKSVLEANLANLKQSLEDKGFNIKGFQVSVGEHFNKGNSGESQGHSSFSPRGSTKQPLPLLSDERPGRLQETMDFLGNQVVNYLV
ncbi:MAG TPA: hypothetical protein HA348_01495 [Thermoplasmata archaeon]|nr:hypothetical protein [Thermoplasmata archaeon]